MSVEIGSYVDVTTRAAELGCRAPRGIALLPRNFESAERRDELVHDASGLSVRAAWRGAGIEECRLEPEGELWPAAQQDAAEWLGPVIFVAGSVLSNNPDAISVALGVVANYVTDFFRGTPMDRQRASLTVVVETEEGQSRRVDYQGPAEGIRDLPDVIREVRS
jgi:hypothetical protein